MAPRRPLEGVPEEAAPDLSLEALQRGLDWTASAERALVQLALPGPDALSFWCAPQQGTPLETVALEVPELGLITPRLDVVRDGARVIAVRATLDGLPPSTLHRVHVRVNGESFVRSAATAPSPAADQDFGFLAFSCFAPFPQNKRSRASQNALERLAQRSNDDRPDAPAFVLGMGDQIYVDHGVWPRPSDVSLLSGSRSETIRYSAEAGRFFDVLYRAHFALTPFDDALSRVPSAMMWDDHEIRDGWGSHGDEAALMARSARWREHVANARRYFIAYQGLRNPLPWGALPDGQLVEQLVRLDAPDEPAGPALHFSFDWGRLATFFVMDLRSHRRRDRVVRSEQLDAIRRWLSSGDPGRGRLYVLVSSIPVTLPIWLSWDPGRWFFPRIDDALDQWWSEGAKGQANELRSMLAEHFASHALDRLLILSGDVHYSEARAVTLPDGTVIGHEVVSSGLAQSFGHKIFSVARRIEDHAPEFVDGELRSTSLGRHYGPGFVEIAVRKNSDVRGGPPRVGVAFHFGGKQSASPPILRELPIRPAPLRGVGLMDCFVDT